MITQDLPIYNSIREYVTAYVGVFDKVKHIHKYYLAKDIYEKSLSLFEYIETANKASVPMEKIRLYDESGTIVDGILTRFRIAGDTGVIGREQQARLSKMLVDINKQLSGLKSHFTKCAAFMEREGQPNTEK